MTPTAPSATAPPAAPLPRPPAAPLANATARPPRAAPPAPTPEAARRGLALGALGVLVFALTFPMTRLAVGPADAPQLPPAFVAIGRAAGAGLLSVAYLLLVRAPRPRRGLWAPLAVSALGTVLGFPLASALALREVPAMHAAVVTGILPLATAALAAWVLRQRAPALFWACALAGCALVVAFALRAGGGGLAAADGWLLLAVACAAGGYVAGARVAAELPAQQVICWVLVGSLPFTLPATLASWPAAPASAAAWGGFAYVSVFSMWLGFFAWYRGLALGGALRVSQVQLLQPFLALLAAVPLLGERLQAETLLFALAVLATVVAGRHAPTWRFSLSPAWRLRPSPARRARMTITRSPRVPSTGPAADPAARPTPPARPQGLAGQPPKEAP